MLTALVRLNSKLIVLLLFGYRMQAISILGREVMQPRGLIGLGHDSIDFCGLEIAQVSNAAACNLTFVYYPFLGFPRICICKSLPNSHSLYARQGSDWTASSLNPATPRRSS